MLVNPHQDTGPRQTLVLDCPPGNWESYTGVDASSAAVSQGVEQVLRTLKSIQEPIASKAKLVELLTEQGLSMELAQWMTLNLVKVSGGTGFRFAFDLPIIEQLFESHKATDFRPALEAKGDSDFSQVLFVRAGKNPAWTPDVVGHLLHECPSSVDTVELPGAGHWLHSEKPHELFELLAPAFQSP